MHSRLRKYSRVIMRRAPVHYKYEDANGGGPKCISCMKMRMEAGLSALHALRQSLIHYAADSSPFPLWKSILKQDQAHSLFEDCS